MLTLDDAKQGAVACFAWAQGVDWLAVCAALLVIVSLACKIKEFLAVRWPWEVIDE